MPYRIPAKPKTDDEHLELLAKIVFVIGFNYDLVEERWPKIRNAFKGFSIPVVREMSPDALMDADGMIRNWRKIGMVIENAKECDRLVEEQGGMQDWVASIVHSNEEDPIFSPTLAEECQRRFKGIGETTRDWVAYVFAEGKDEPEVRHA